MQPINADKIVDTYVQLRDKRDCIRREQQEALAPYNEAMSKLEDIMLTHLLALGADNIKTPHGTAYQAELVSAKVTDWDSTLQFIRAEELWHMLEKRVSKQAVAEFVQETGHLPPGVDIARTKTVNIRRS